MACFPSYLLGADPGPGPLTYDSASLADSVNSDDAVRSAHMDDEQMQDLNADIKRRENIWDSLVDRGGEEYADLKVSDRNAICSFVDLISLSSTRCTPFEMMQTE